MKLPTAPMMIALLSLATVPFTTAWKVEFYMATGEVHVRERITNRPCWKTVRLLDDGLVEKIMFNPHTSLWPDPGHLEVFEDENCKTPPSQRFVKGMHILDPPRKIRAMKVY